MLLVVANAAAAAPIPLLRLPLSVKCIYMTASAPLL
jgi:hypothetical protein